MIHWLLLTGGASSRFGRDKASTMFGDRSLRERAMHAIRAVDATGSFTAVGPDRSGGPAAAVVSMLPEIDQEFVGVLAVDMPFAEGALASVVDACRRQVDDSGVQAWVPIDSAGRRQWLCAIYRREALVDAAAAIPDWQGGAFHRLVGGLAAFEIPLESDVSLLDVDTPEDLQKALGVADLIPRDL